MPLQAPEAVQESALVEAQVQYFFENVSLATVTGTTSFTYNLDTTKYSNAGHNGGYWVYDSTGTVVYKSPSINFSINNTTSSGGGGTGTGTLLTFGSYVNGDLSEFNDSSCGGSNVAVHVGGGPNNTNWARYSGTASTQCYGDTANIRIHTLQFKGGQQPWFNANGKTVWRALSVRIPSGFSNSGSSGYLFAGDEVHGDNGSGSAPLNLTAQNGYWQIIIRGSNYPTANPSGGYPFAQYSFGSNTGSSFGGSYFRQYQSWAGGNHAVVPDEWVHFRLGFHFDYTDNNGVGNGWFVAYARWGNMTSWVNIVPQVNNIPLGYPDLNGDGYGIYPILSLYRPTSGATGTYAIDYADGAWSTDQTTLSNWQNSRLGF